MNWIIIFSIAFALLAVTMIVIGSYHAVLNRKKHWERVYTRQLPGEVSWYQEYPALSLQLIKNSEIHANDAIIDVGGGPSVLVDHLLDEGFEKITVLDISASAIRLSRERLKERGSHVDWIEADITHFKPPHQYRLWHDRAVFHFLTDQSDREQYLRVMKDALLPGGDLIIATFGTCGPRKCSGLPVVRYDSEALCSLVGDEFTLREELHETHLTPGNVQQHFTYFRFTRTHVRTP